MRYINVTECAALDGKSLARALAGLTLVTHVVFTKCDGLDDDGISALVVAARGLRSIFANVCDRVTDRGCAQLAQLSTLEGVTLPSSVTDASLAAIATANPGIVAVDLTEKTNLTDAGVAALLRSCPLLRTLTITDCSRLTDAAFAPLSDPVSPSAGLCLRNFTAQSVPLTDTSIRAIAGRCRDLMNFDVLRNTHVTDVGVSALASGCSLLSSVWLSFCRNITDASLVAFGGSGSTGVPLSLDIYGCDQITFEAVLTLLSTRRIKDLNVNFQLHQRLIACTPEQLRGARIHSSRGDPIF
jgi:F-box/leucine-rich repeat protein 2/20